MPLLDRDGIGIHYVTSGSPGAPAVLLSHGYSATQAMWAPTARALASDHRCITWDLRGHGQSGDPDDPDRYSPELALGDMEALLDADSVAGAVLVGHSLGGYLSLRFQQRSPARVRALVLVDTGPGYRSDDARAGWNDMCEGFAQDFEAHGLDGRPDASPEVAAATHRSATGLIHAARRILTQHDATVVDHLPAVDVPTLVLVGSKDRPFLAGAEYMARKIPGAHHVVIDGAGHAPMLTHPDAFLAELRHFLDQLR